MGNCCETCLKSQIGRKNQIIDDEGSSLKLRSVKQQQQIIFSNTLLTIECFSIQKVQVDRLIIFVERPELAIQNQFIAKLGTSQVTNLVSKIGDIMKLTKYPQSQPFIIKIQAPFHSIPIRQLLICELKVSNGSTHQNKYLKTVISNALDMIRKGGKRVSLGVLQLQPEFGYNLRDFYKFLMVKIREHSDKFSCITYVTHKRAEIQNFLQEDLPEILQTESVSSSQQSNYY